MVVTRAGSIDHATDFNRRYIESDKGHFWKTIAQRRGGSVYGSQYHPVREILVSPERANL
jgi:hypothetical protein